MFYFGELVQRKKVVLIFTALIFISMILINSAQVFAENLSLLDDSSDSGDLDYSNSAVSNLNIEAEGFILIDSKTGLVVCENNANKVGVYPASTTKIMTAIIALENKELNTVMTASQAAIYDIGPGGMNIGIMAGEELTLWTLLNAMLVCSANEAANIIAENVASSREEFIALMNARAKELGATNTNFINTNGMHDEQHYTTASDMAIIARHAMKIPAFREIVIQDCFQMPATNKHKDWNPLYTTNKLLRYGLSDDCDFNVIGIKTGFTTPAGHNLVTAAVNEDGMELISVILGVKNARAYENIYKYTEKLLKYGFNNYMLDDIIEKDSCIATISVPNSKDKNTLDLITQQSVYGVLPKTNSNSAIENIVKKVHLNPAVTAPIKKGQVLGYVEFWKDDLSLGITNIISADSMEEVIPSRLSVNFNKVSSNATGFISNTIYVLKNSFLYSLLKVLFLVSISLLILRIILKKVSRKLNSRKFKRY